MTRQTLTPVNEQQRNRFPHLALLNVERPNPSTSMSIVNIGGAFKSLPPFTLIPPSCDETLDVREGHTVFPARFIEFIE
ncbi:hypothetical protein EW146_g9595 [Bondarzewia mesenterica]|uniref:Uncharacterized protein n=1 Tax=Bondarzewia mesenterica TaxID=1095465 RepID=A0A4S4LA14_9AGAM|nr:hypothetical protein EW146_g9595 [Bondarzewia mesenterica]